MSNSFMSQMFLALFIGLISSSSLRADFEDYNYKAWNQPSKSSSQMVMRTRSYRASAPAVVQSESTPAEVAQAPSELRSYSYDPAQEKDVQSPCGCNATKSEEPATAQNSKQSNRSYSYEPQMNSSNSYSAPRMRYRSNQSSPTPAYLLEKTNPRKFNH